MAYAATALHKIAENLFRYVTADSNATVVASGYFNSATDMLKQYDIILLISATGGTPLLDPIFVTSATGAATVTTSTAET